MLRKVAGLVVLLAALLSGRAEAQSCNGCGIGYRPPGFTGSYVGSGKFDSVCIDSTNSEHCWARNSATTSVFNVGGSAYQALGQVGIINRVTLPICWSSGVPGNQMCDTLLYRDGAANTLALRNGTAAQAFNIYNTYTDASNYERGVSKFTANVFQIGTEAAGTGSPRPIAFYLNGGNRWFIHPTTYAFYPAADGAQTIGGPTYKVKEFYLAESIQGSKTKALTEGAATTVATVAVPQTAAAAFAAGEVKYTVFANDSTDFQVLNGVALFSAVNKAGTETCTIEDNQITDEAASAGTLACTIACAVGLTDVVGITLDCTSSLTQTTLNALVRFDMQQPNTLTFP